MNLQHSFDERLGLTCGIDGCNYVFNVVSSYRVNVRTWHPLHWDENNCSMQANHTTVDMEKCECEMEKSENVSHQTKQSGIHF